MKKDGDKTLVNGSRVRTLKEGEIKKGPVVCWMSREQRAKDNWALLYAQELAMEKKAPLLVAFALAPRFLGATKGSRPQGRFSMKNVPAFRRDDSIWSHCLASAHRPFYKIPEGLLWLAVDQRTSWFSISGRTFSTLKYTTNRFLTS
ncbi:MAG: DNA photolyase [Syntrophus sp. PtaU1.Bin208]|nr:MAG: DNA photolyase [Syntrophus sp. PtaU1.Bin208]